MEATQTRIVLLGDRMCGKTAAAAALLGLPCDNAVVKVGHSTAELSSHCGRWFGKEAEDELTVLDTVGFGGSRDAANAGKLLHHMRDVGSMTAFVLVLSAEQPLLSEGYLEFLRLLEETLGRGFWAQTALLFTRWYTDDRSCRRRKTSKAQLRQDVSQALLKEFPAVASARPAADAPELPSYFVDSEAVIAPDSESAEVDAAMKELRRFSAWVRSNTNFKTIAASAQQGAQPATTARSAARPRSVEETSKKPVRPGELVTVENIFAGALVKPGSSWRWQNQAGTGVAKLGEVIDWSSATQWATVLWYTSGQKNRYRIGAQKAHDLKHAAPNAGEEHEQAAQRAVRAGEKLQEDHLKRTFAYPVGTQGASTKSRFDIRDEVCMAVGGFKHGQIVRWQGQQATTVGVRPTNEGGELKLFFHLQGSDPQEGSDAEDNEEMCGVSSDLQLTFGYLRGVTVPEFGLFDVRDEICLKVGRFKHGAVVQIGPLPKRGVVVGVALGDDWRPRLWIHMDDAPGAGLFNDETYAVLRQVGHKQLEEVSKDHPDFQDEPEDELRALASKVCQTFGYPCGTGLRARYGEFDTRDEICRQVGGFTHGQVVEDANGNEAVVIGVQVTDGVPKLFFHVDGKPGAGVYPRLHVARRSMRVLRTKEVVQVCRNDAMFSKGGVTVLGSGPTSLEQLLRSHGADSSDSAEEEEDCSGLVLDETFRYLLGGSMEIRLFDVRDEICLRVGGFTHGQVLKDIDGEELHVIGVLCAAGKVRFAVHGSGDYGALCLPPEHCRVLRSLGSACVVGHRAVQELQQYGAPREPLLPTFSFPIGALMAHRVVKFDIRDEICLEVGGFRHGDMITMKNKKSKGQVPDGTVIGVYVDQEDGRAKLWCQAKGRRGAGVYDGLAEDADWAKRVFKVVKHVEVEEVEEAGFKGCSGGVPDPAELMEECKQQ